jgi:hypothetical protein
MMGTFLTGPRRSKKRSARPTGEARVKAVADPMSPEEIARLATSIRGLLDDPDSGQLQGPRAHRPRPHHGDQQGWVRIGGATPERARVCSPVKGQRG